MKSLILISIFTSLFSKPAMAISPIMRTYQSVRATAMGNVRYTTGLDEENFFGNPARITDQPKKMIQVPKFSFEAGSGALGSMSDLIGTSQGPSAFSDSVGKPISARFQFVLPAIYKTSFLTPDWSFAAGLLFNSQIIGQVSQSGIVTPTTILGGGPAITIARRLLEEDRLSVGLTTHFEYRATSANPVNMLDFLRGSVASSLRGGSGLGIDFDLGTTFRPHWGLGGFDYQLGLAINNILGGTYDNLGSKIKGWSGIPKSTPTSLNFGVSASKESFWNFHSFVMALEFSDLGNNTNGSFFKLIHLGAEAKWKKFAFRTGLNQGYIGGGFGMDFGFFTFNLATYGEELGLNVGSMEDRRYAFDFGFTI